MGDRERIPVMTLTLFADPVAITAAANGRAPAFGTTLDMTCPTWDPEGEPDGPGSPDDRYLRHPHPIVALPTGPIWVALATLGTEPGPLFVNSLSDLFHRDVPVDVIAEIFAVMALADAHTFQVLTKRADIMARVLSDPGFLPLVDDHRERLRPGCGDFTWPLPNVWLGVSIESDRYTFRADHLRRTPAAVRWISAEPLLGPLPSLDLTSIDWVVAGGESGASARPMAAEWVRDLRDRCTLVDHEACGWSEIARTGDPDRGCDCHLNPRPSFLFKQWGAWAPYSLVTDRAGIAVYMPEDDPEDSDRWMQRIGKHAAGRLLDGRTWDEFPS